MDGILAGDWHRKGDVLRVRQQSGTSVRVYSCNEARYFNSPNRYCQAHRLKVYVYRADIDAFFTPEGGGICASSLQVSADAISNLVFLADPYVSGTCRDSGQAFDYRVLPPAAEAATPTRDTGVRSKKIPAPPVKETRDSPE